MRLRVTPSFSRILNASRVWGSYHWSRLTGRMLAPSYPVSISIEPTTSCNLRCPECPSGLRSFTRPTGSIAPELFRSIIDQVSGKVIYLTFYFQGEPYLHPAFNEMVEYAASKKVFTVTSTNGHYLDPEKAEAIVRSGLGRLIISLDGMSQQTYERYRIGGELDTVLQGIRNMVKAKSELRSSSPEIVVQFIVMEHNKHERSIVREAFRDLIDVKIIFKTVQVYDFENGNSLIPKEKELSRYYLNGTGKFKIDNHLEDHCWKMWHSCVITWDGKVVPCCFDKDAKYVMGDINKTSLGEIWHSDAYSRFRTSLLKGRKEIEICKNCSEGSRVQLSPEV